VAPFALFLAYSDDVGLDSSAFAVCCFVGGGPCRLAPVDLPCSLVSEDHPFFALVQGRLFSSWEDTRSYRPDQFPSEFVLESLLCALCNLVPRAPIRLLNGCTARPPCQHLFCAKCIAPVIGTGGGCCPECGIFTTPTQLLEDLPLEALIANNLLPRYRDDHALNYRNHYAPEQKAEALGLFLRGGVKMVREDERFATEALLPRSTLRYWYLNPGTVDHRKPGSTGLPSFAREVEDLIETEVLSLLVPSVVDITTVALKHAHESQRRGPFKCSPSFVNRFCKQRDLHLLLAHPVSAKRWASVKAARLKDPAVVSLQENDMLWSISDLLAKRTLMAERGKDQLQRYVVCDEMRYAADCIYAKGKAKVLVKYKKGDAPKRAYVPLQVPLSFKPCTLMFSASLAGDKLGVFMVQHKKNLSKVHIPTVDELNLNLSSDQRKQLPADLLVCAASDSSWNNSVLHSTVYLPGVLEMHARKHGHHAPIVSAPSSHSSSPSSSSPSQAASSSSPSSSPSSISSYDDHEEDEGLGQADWDRRCNTLLASKDSKIKLLVACLKAGMTWSGH
jgi:hypothetical protein